MSFAKIFNFSFDPKVELNKKSEFVSPVRLQNLEPLAFYPQLPNTLPLAVRSD
jgi:hypothetical protein